MKLLYGTANPAKLASMCRRLSSLDLEIIGLNDIKQELPEIIEDGNTPLENASKKALAYYKALHIPVFSCDTGLYIDELPDELQPGVHVRTINGNYLTDEEMIHYYSGLALKYGNLKAKYRNAICLVLDENHIYKAMEQDMESEPFIITSKPHQIIKKGFPLDSLSIDIKTGRYFYDLEENKTDELAVEDGFFKFFKNILMLERRK